MAHVTPKPPWELKEKKGKQAVYKPMNKAINSSTAPVELLHGETAAAGVSRHPCLTPPLPAEHGAANTGESSKPNGVVEEEDVRQVSPRHERQGT